MKKIVIIEDEIPARKKVIDFIKRLNEPVDILAELSSVQEALEFFSKPVAIDLIFSDIQLLDGLSFEIFEQVSVTCPVIFTTAYDRYWMDAFEANGIDYLLKPFGFERFKKSWEKYHRITKADENPEMEFLQQFQSLIKSKSGTSRSVKSRIMVPCTSGMYFLDLAEVVYFIAENGVVKAMDSSGKRHLLRQTTLKELEEILDSGLYYRINRSQLVNKYFVEKLERYSKNTVVVSFKNLSDRIVSSQSATAGFLHWLEE